jgi:hypothetical protein
MRNLIFFAVSLTMVLGASAGVPKDDVAIKIDELKVFKKAYRGEDSPNLDGLPRGQDHWVMFALKYELKVTGRSVKSDDKWINDLSIGWEILIPCGPKNAKVPVEKDCVFFTKTVNYQNVEADGEHYGLIFVDPKTYERYRKKMLKDGDFYVQVRIRIDGKTKAMAWMNGRHTHTEGTRFPANFYPRSQARSWFEVEEARKPKGGLVNRRDTPWAYSGGALDYIVLPSGNRD